MKDRLVEILRERSVRHGRFTLASGKQSDLYVDARQTTLHPEGAAVREEEQIMNSFKSTKDFFPDTNKGRHFPRHRMYTFSETQNTLVPKSCLKLGILVGPKSVIEQLQVVRPGQPGDRVGRPRLTLGNM